jgi:UDP-N-acetylglucosamine acyltransferase
MLSSLGRRAFHRAEEDLMNHVHPTAVIGADVRVGSGNVIGAFAVILGPVEIGDGNWIGPHVVIGTPAEIRGIDHGLVDGGVGTGISIGDANVIREYTTVHQGNYARTIINNGCYLMNRCYIAHDDVLDDGVTMASGVALGGHVKVGSGANLGMGAIVHQRRMVGPLAMVGMSAVVTRDVPPAALAYGNPCRVRGANRVGMQRAGVGAGAIAAVDLAYSAGQVQRFDDDPVLARAWSWWTAQNAPAP